MENKLNEYRNLIEKELEIALHSNSNVDSGVEQAMRYSTLGGGKRIRGILALEFCRVFGSDVKKGLAIAAAIEMVQAFSLIHDDLPCMDDDDFRRGKPSCHKQFNEATALLAGDALLANAFNTVSSTAFLPKPHGIKPVNTVSIMSTLSNATMEMIRGQQADMEFESRDSITQDEILSMYSRKTCALISAACVCGAICADASEKGLHKARSYGFALGMAFQLTDDLLDLQTEKDSKKTIATLIGEKDTAKLIKEYTDTAVKIAQNLPNGEFLETLAKELIDRKN